MAGKAEGGAAEAGVPQSAVFCCYFSRKNKCRYRHCKFIHSRIPVTTQMAVATGTAVFVCDYSNHAIVRVESDGGATTIASGPPEVHYPDGLAFDAAGGRVYWSASLSSAPIFVGPG